MKTGIYKIKGGSLSRRDAMVLGVLDIVSGTVKVLSLGSIGTDWAFRYTARVVKRNLQLRRAKGEI